MVVARFHHAWPGPQRAHQLVGYLNAARPKFHAREDSSGPLIIVTIDKSPDLWARLAKRMGKHAMANG